VSHIVIPYRGNFVRRVGSRIVHADVNQALFFNAGEEYRIDHINDDGDACLSLDLSEQAWAEQAGPMSLHHAQRRIGPALQLLAARLRHDRGDMLRAEEIGLRITRELLIPDRSLAPATVAQRRLVNRAKHLLHADPRHRWSLREIADAIGTSPVHLTQMFSKVEGMPLYRYQTQLRLALALHQLPVTDDLAALALDLGFSSHSQFTTAFKRMYGVPPSTYRART